MVYMVIRLYDLVFFMRGAGGCIAIDAYWISLRAKLFSGVVSDLL